MIVSDLVTAAGTIGCFAVSLAMLVTTALGGNEPAPLQGRAPRFPLLSDADAWKRLPPALRGTGTPLPSWARMLAGDFPAATAAFLQLDLAQRTRSPIPADLRAAMRWVAAQANQCAYAAACAARDAKEAGVDERRLKGLGQPGYPGWSADEKSALEFARGMTVDSDSVTDAHFADLVQRFGEQRTASMVLLMAYANFQDRFLLCLGAPLESDGPRPPADVEFSPEALVVHTTPPPALTRSTPAEAPTDAAIETPPEWSRVTYQDLQSRLESQRRKPTRLRIPTWEEVARNVPEGMFNRPSDIIWYRIVFGYAPELAVPFETFMRTAGAEGSSRWDRILGGSLFWVTTKGVKCPYCMGHCEMNWEVAGLTPAEIADRSRILAGDEWSGIAPREQHALAVARKLSLAPNSVTDQDVDRLKSDFGADRALLILLNSSRYHYMTRISNGFQLTLERDNVFYEYYNVRRPDSVDSLREVVPSVPLLSDEECWKRLPAVVSAPRSSLPSWVRGVAEHLPRTAAAMLQLDYAQRVLTPLEPALRARMRWVVAKANRCEYSQAYALTDLARVDTNPAASSLLTGDPARWPEADRDPLEFARLLTVAAPKIPDELFERLRVKYGDKQVAAMVLLAAYGNFQDRLVLGLRLPLELDGPLPPLDVKFSETAFQVAPFVPADEKLAARDTPGQSVVSLDDDWGGISYDELQTRLERQRNRLPRLPIPSWDDVKKQVPPAMASRPTRIVWNLVCAGYVPELAIPWSIATRTMWAETRPDRVFEESLFWIQTRSVECNYCMGHCEMLLEVAGLDQNQIAERTRKLASSDWSDFSPTEQRAYAYARKLSQTPWELTPTEYQILETDLGRDKALATFWWLCRGLYMTRVSDGFQLPLERDNVFQSLPATPSSSK